MAPGCHLATPACWWRCCFPPPPDPVVPCSESTDSLGRCFGLVAFGPREWSGPGPDCSPTGHSAEVVRRQWLGWFVEKTSCIFLSFRGAHQRASGQAVCWLVVPPTMGGAPDGLPAGLPGGATMFPDVLGCSGGSDRGMVLPASPVCCESEFFVSNGCEQPLTEATTVQSAAAAGHAI